MEAKTKRIITLFGVLLILGLFRDLSPQRIFVIEPINENILQDCDHDHSHGNFDILNGYQGSESNVEERYMQVNQILTQPINATVSNPNKCNSIAASHGPNRENGNVANFLFTGCSNWRGYSYTYGTTNIPFFIDERNMTVDRSADIRAQAAMWNQAIMHDGTGQIVNLYEVNHTNLINLRPVVVVSQANLGNGIAGLFTPSRATPTIQVSSSMNLDTPVHEFGHLLGLDDIDTAAGVADGTHKVLMGYSRGTTTSTLGNAIKYQDIQGIARVNNRHTSHKFTRYVMNNNRYIHFCFYCDTIDDRVSVLSGSQAMANAVNCIHNYDPMVSHGDRHWHKCTGCYRVIESNHMAQGYQHQGTATNHFLECTECKYRINCVKTAIYTGKYNEISHVISCNCGYGIPQAHDTYQSGILFYCRVCPWKGRFGIGKFYLIFNKVENEIEEDE